MPIESTYTSQTGLTVHRHVFEPEGEVRGGAVFVHGLGDHGGRHTRHLQLFADHGIRCIAVDLPGHGRTEGRRGHIASFDVVMAIINESLESLRNELPENASLGLAGHSMGGFLALLHLTRYPGSVNFSWISSPLIEPSANAHWLKRSLGVLVNRVHPIYTLQSGIGSHQCKRDPESIKATAADTLVHRYISVRLGALLLKAASELRRGVSRMNPDLSVLMTHGSADRICPPRYSRAYFERIPALHKDYVSFEGLLHEPFNDLGKEQVYETLNQWLDQLITGKEENLKSSFICAA